LPHGHNRGVLWLHDPRENLSNAAAAASALSARRLP
jgi:hypothetical protein